MALSLAQQSIAASNKRFKVVIAGRRFGKTHLSIREMCKAASIPNREVWYVAPTYKMCKTIVWRKLKNKLVDLNWALKVNESELTIVLKNNSVISLKSADHEDNLRGVGLDYLIIDEFADIKPEAWYEVLRPTLSDKQGGAMFIGTPKGSANWAFELYTMNEFFPEQWASFQYTTLDGGNVSAEEIETARRDLDERTFRQEYMATFETYAGRIFYSFDRKLHVKKYELPTPQTLYLGMDFNVNPMSVVILAREGDVLHAIDEIRMFSSNTQEAVDEIKSRYPKAKIWCYPDPASRQRKTSAGGATDLTILQNAGFVVKAPNAHNPVRDGINAVNARLLSSKGMINLYVDPKCKHTIEGLERFTYKEGTSQPDKDSGYDHMMDALRYAVDYMFPVRRDIDPDLNSPQRWTHNIGAR